MFLLHPPPQKRKEKKKPKLAYQGPRDEVDSMVCFQTRPRVNCAIVTNWFSSLVWSDHSGQWSGLVLKGSWDDLISQEVHTDLKSSVHKILCLETDLNSGWQVLLAELFE